MKLALINSAWAQAGRETAYGIRRTREIGFDAIDLFADPLDLDIQERRLIRETAAAVELPIISVCCVALGLIDLNPSVRRFHHQRCEAYLDFVYDMGGQNLLLVLGEYIWQREVIPAAEQWAWAVESVQRLGHRAAALGLEIALEMEPFRESLLNDVASMRLFLDDVNSPAVKANVDISHMVLAGQRPETLEGLRGRVGHVHISDCDGRVHGDLPPGRGVVDFAPYLQAIKRLNIDNRAISVELEYSPQPARIGEWVEEAYAATSQLMKAAGLRE